MEIKHSLSQTFFVGQNVDALDKVNFWLNAEILGIQNDKIFIHYTGWHPKYDQLITIHSGRILKQWDRSKPISLNNRIDVYHPIGGWLQARVIELGQSNQQGQITQVKVHFFKYHPKYDMWVNLKDKNQVTIIGEKSKGYGMGKRKRTMDKKKLLSELARKILSQKLQKMIRQLEETNLYMKQVGGDGNCLFRAISDQLYGEQTFHSQIRQMCMKYILQEKVFFQDFMVEDLEEYVARKSRDGVWGDDIEIEALSEIYSRPIEIYAMDIKPIRTFHEDNPQNVQPMRLAYIGSCHYNSIKRRNQQGSALLASKFGEYQNTFLTSYLESKQSEVYWINLNRNKFSHFNPLQLTIQQRIQSQTSNNKHSPLQDTETDLMQQAIQISQNQQIYKEIQAAQLKQLERKIEQQALEKQLKRLEEQQLQQAKKISTMGARSPVHNAKQRPYWFGDLLMMGFSQEQIWFGIEIKGYDPESVQNFLLDNM